jgi:hypothetical protein
LDIVVGLGMKLRLLLQARHDLSVVKFGLVPVKLNIHSMIPVLQVERQTVLKLLPSGLTNQGVQE